MASVAHDNITKAQADCIVFVGGPKFGSGRLHADLAAKWPRANYHSARVGSVADAKGIVAIIVDPDAPPDQQLAQFTKGVNQLATMTHVTSIAFAWHCDAFQDTIDQFAKKRPGISVSVHKPPHCLVAGDPYFRKVKVVRHALQQLPQGSLVVYATGLIVQHLTGNIVAQAAALDLPTVSKKTNVARYGMAAAVQLYSELLKDSDMAIDKVIIFHHDVSKAVNADRDPTNLVIHMARQKGIPVDIVSTV